MKSAQSDEGSGVTYLVQYALHSSGGDIRLWIEDNGIGIAPEHQARIFRIFERLHGRESYSGNGIGLAIVEKAITRMNGRVGVESAPGQGSRFWFELPANPPSQGASAMAEVDDP